MKKILLLLLQTFLFPGAGESSVPCSEGRFNYIHKTTTEQDLPESNRSASQAIPAYKYTVAKGVLKALVTAKGNFSMQRPEFVMCIFRSYSRDHLLYPLLPAGSRYGFSWLGGSFGLGLPLMSSNEAQSASFFLGPSLYLGRQERLVLTAGLMGGRITRLANGLQVWDYSKRQ